MARIRSVKPGLRTSEVVASWPFEVRYFWVLLWGYLDDLGRSLDIPKSIAGDCFPLETDDYNAKVFVSEYIPIGHYEVQESRPAGGWQYYTSPNWFVQGLQDSGPD